LDAAATLATRKPLEDLEAEVVRRHLARPDELTPGLLDALRYVLNFAKLGQVRASDGQDVAVGEALAGLRWRVVSALEPHLQGSDPTLWGAVRELPGLVRETRSWRDRLLRTTGLDRAALEAEVTERQLCVASGGGGGSGYGYAGAFRALHHAGLQPELLAGTSIGSLLSMFRARYRVFDGSALVAAAQRLSWNTVFRVLQTESRYGIPATLRLYLRTALESMFKTRDGRTMTFRDVEIPLLVVATGLTVEGLKHDLSYYEHFLDDVVTPGAIARTGGIKRVGRLVGVVRDLMSDPEALREVVFGADPLTMDVDVLDAAGFSSAVPGIIHYDVLRDDQRTKRLLDQLYAAYGITRLTEGGLVNNVPARPAWTEVMRGRIVRRNPFVLGLDCFAPKPMSLAFYPLQQVVRPNVKANQPYMDHYFALDRRLSPVNLVPSVQEVGEAMDWTAEELKPHLPFIQAMCTPFASLADAGEAA
jgi:predicted acylesterase/phospholipase RssA